MSWASADECVLYGTAEPTAGAGEQIVRAVYESLRRSGAHTRKKGLDHEPRSDTQPRVAGA